MGKPEQGLGVGIGLVAGLFVARAISFVCYMEVWPAQGRRRTRARLLPGMYSGSLYFALRLSDLAPI
jgi:hypothetical protein